MVQTMKYHSVCFGKIQVSIGVLMPPQGTINRNQTVTNQSSSQRALAIAGLSRYCQTLDIGWQG